MKAIQSGAGCPSVCLNSGGALGVTAPCRFAWPRVAGCVVAMWLASVLLWSACGFHGAARYVQLRLHGRALRLLRRPGDCGGWLLDTRNVVAGCLLFERGNDGLTCRVLSRVVTPRMKDAARGRIRR